MIISSKRGLLEETSATEDVDVGLIPAWHYLLWQTLSVQDAHVMDFRAWVNITEWKSWTMTSFWAWDARWGQFHATSARVSVFVQPSDRVCIGTCFLWEECLSVCSLMMYLHNSLWYTVIESVGECGTTIRHRTQSMGFLWLFSTYCPRSAEAGCLNRYILWSETLRWRKFSHKKYCLFWHIRLKGNDLGWHPMHCSDQMETETMERSEFSEWPVAQCLNVVKGIKHLLTAVDRWAPSVIFSHGLWVIHGWQKPMAHGSYIYCTVVLYSPWPMEVRLLYNLWPMGNWLPIGHGLYNSTSTP